MVISCLDDTPSVRLRLTRVRGSCLCLIKALSKCTYKPLDKFFKTELNLSFVLYSFI